MAITGRTLRLEAELRKQLATVTNRQTRDLVRAWAKAWDELAPDLTDTMAGLLADGNVTRAQLLRSARLTKALAEVADRLEALVADAGITITGDLRGIIRDAGKAQAALVASQLPTKQDLVDLDAWSRVDGRQLEAIVKRSTEQITARSRPLSRTAADAVRRELIRGVAAGSNPKATARRMVARARTGFNGGLTRALTIARTETLDAHRSAAALGQAQHRDILAGWEWLASIGPRTCPACWGMHGTFHELDEPGPNGHQNCRCARLPVVKPWSELGFDLKEPTPLRVDGDAAFAALTPSQQLAVLGSKGFVAWKAGKFPRSAWAKRQQNPGWRDSFVPARPPKVAAPAPAKKRAAPPKTRKSKPAPAKDLLADVPRINPELLANMERRGIDTLEWARRTTNPKYAQGNAFSVNCQRVVQAHELRRRGYDVTAAPNPGDGSDRAAVFMKWFDGAEDRAAEGGRYLVSADTKRLVDAQAPDIGAQMITDPEKYVRETVESWPVGGRGWVTFYRDGAAGHIFNIERTADGVRVVEAQVPNGGELLTLSHYMAQVRMTRRRNGQIQLAGHDLFVARVDDLEFNDKVRKAIEWQTQTTG